MNLFVMLFLVHLMAHLFFCHLSIYDSSSLSPMQHILLQKSIQHDSKANVPFTLQDKYVTDC